MSPVGVLAVDHEETGLRATRSLISAVPDFALVSEARSAEEAVEAAVRLRPQLVLVRAGLPAIDGHETAQRLRELVPQAVVEVLPENGSTLTPAALRSLWGERRSD